MEDVVTATSHPWMSRRKKQPLPSIDQHIPAIIRNRCARTISHPPQTSTRQKKIVDGEEHSSRNLNPWPMRLQFNTTLQNSTGRNKITTARGAEMNLDVEIGIFINEPSRGNQRSNLVLTQKPCIFFSFGLQLFQILQYAYPQAEPQAHLRGPLQGYATTNNAGREEKGRH